MRPRSPRWRRTKHRAEQRARRPKKLVVLPITHYEIYGGKWRDESARLACEWFERFLK